MTNRFLNTQVVIASLLLLVTLVGCGEAPFVAVSGQVLMDGKPLLKAGFIRLEPVDGRASTGTINADDGTFVLTNKKAGDGIKRGEHPVAIIVTVPVGREQFSIIDKKYRNAGTSGITAKIDGPTDGLVINLTGGFRKIPKRRVSNREHE